MYDLYDEDTKSDMDATVYYGKLNLGLAYSITNHIRPYVQGGIGYYSSPYNFFTYTAVGDEEILDETSKPGLDKVIGFSLGGGIDLIISKHFMITLGADYNWMHYARSFIEGAITEEGFNPKSSFTEALKNPDFHYLEYKIGLGFTW